MSNSAACDVANLEAEARSVQGQGTHAVPLSLEQQRLWFLSRLQAGSAIHSLAHAIELRGQLNRDVIRRVLETIVQRHQVLRTTVGWLDEQPLPQINPPKLAFVEIDLRFLPEALRAAECQQQIAQIVKYRFDLQQGDLLRTTLIWLTSETAILLITNHQLVADDHSIATVFWPEFGQLYEAFRQNFPNPLPQLSMQFSDFAIWQKAWLESAKGQTQLAYWHHQLSGSLPVLDLPTDRPRPAIQSFQSARAPFTLSADLTKALQALSHAAHVTLEVTLLAAFKTLLHRYSQQTDVLIGQAVTHRPPLELRQLIGCWRNFVVLRTDLAGGLTFRGLLDRLPAVMLAAQAHQEVPLAKILTELQARNLSHHPLFQVIFAYQETSALPLASSTLTGQPLTIATGYSEFDLALVISAPASPLPASQLSGYFEYSTDLFEGATIERTIGHFQTLLQGMVADPDQRLADLPLLTAQEYQQLANWNQTALAYPPLAIHQLFEAQVKKTPNAIAIVSENDTLTYQQLNQQANQLAHYLQHLGIQAGDLVGICLERSLPLLVGLLGILKAGAAYVPLDPNYPAERLAMIVADAQTPILLSQRSLLSRLPPSSAQVVLIEADAIQQASDTNCQGGVRPTHPAYVLYTSGSTGRPKGVVIAHASAVSFITWAQTVFSADQLAGVLAATSICFDLSIFELFLPISLGGRVILAENALQLPSLPAAQQVTLINTVPSAIAELLRQRGLPTSARTINLAGEPLSNQLVQALYQQPSIAQVYNLYGPSEATTYATFDLMLKGATAEPSIGKPLSNTQVYILDANQQPVPIGVPGELHIGGAGLAQGYLNRPDLTAEKFMPWPAALTPLRPQAASAALRLYKTGDLARFQPDGKIDFLGRLDFQVKIRGFRVELGEVESLLRQHKAVKAAVVMARADLPDEQRLVAYVVGQTPLTVDDLRHYLKQTLPAYMMPAAFVVLDALPLTPNGKVDRKALPTPQWSTSEPTFVAPANAIEHQLAEIWQAVLGLPLISVTANFFDLGGHSLLIMRLFAQIEQTLGQQLPLTILFQAPTIRQLAALLQQTGSPNLQTAIVQFQSGTQPPLFCLPGAMGNLVYCRGLVRYLPADQPIYGLQEPEFWQGWNLPAHLEEIAAYYLQVLQTVQPQGPYFLLGYSFSGIVAYEMAQQLLAQGHSIAFLGLIDPPLAFSFNTIRRVLTELPGLADRKFLVSTLRRLEIHQLRLSRLTPIEQFKYLLSGVTQRMWPLPVATSRAALASLSDQALTGMESKNYYRAVLNYFPKPYPQPVSLILSRNTYSDFGYWGNWKKLTKINLHLIPGNHLSILREPDVQFLAERVQACLQSVNH